MSISNDYLQFVADNHALGSGTAQSYVTAINKLENALRQANMLSPTQSLWKIYDTIFLAKLYEFVKKEQKKKMAVFFITKQRKAIGRKVFVL